MSVELSPEVEEKAKALVESGRFVSVNEAILAGLEAVEEDGDWADYANERIDAGLADIEAGRTIPAEDFLAWLKSKRQKLA